jgi:hypothetical protein
MVTDYIVHSCLAKHAMLSVASVHEMYINAVTCLIIYSRILL